MDAGNIIVNTLPERIGLEEERIHLCALLVQY